MFYDLTGNSSKNDVLNLLTGSDVSTLTNISEVAGATPVSSGRFFIRPSAVIAADGNAFTSSALSQYPTLIREHSKYSGVYVGYYQSGNSNYIQWRNVLGTYDEATDTFTCKKFSTTAVGTIHVDDLDYMVITDTSVVFLKSDGLNSIALTELDVLSGSEFDVTDKSTFTDLDFGISIQIHGSSSYLHSAALPYLTIDTAVNGVFPNNLDNVGREYLPTHHQLLKSAPKDILHTDRYPQRLKNGQMGLMLREIDMQYSPDYAANFKLSDVRFVSSGNNSLIGKTVTDGNGDTWFIFSCGRSTSSYGKATLFAIKGV